MFSNYYLVSSSRVTAIRGWPSQAPAEVFDSPLSGAAPSQFVMRFSKSADSDGQGTTQREAENKQQTMGINIRSQPPRHSILFVRLLSPLHRTGLCSRFILHILVNIQAFLEKNMFYSYQLLSKKAPLGQIWIAATLHSKIKRRNVDRIDIIEICEQILNPAMPLSLRLLGILMGGVVNIFNRKVQFLFDDANRFMTQINHMTRIAPPATDTTVLPRGKSQARFEAITITYGFQESDQMEQLMLQPRTPNHEPRIFMDEFFLIPPAQNESQEIPMFQADRENITLQEDFIFEDRRHDEIHRLNSNFIKSNICG